MRGEVQLIKPGQQEARHDRPQAPELGLFSKEGTAVFLLAAVKGDVMLWELTRLALVGQWYHLRAIQEPSPGSSSHCSAAHQTANDLLIPRLP